MDRELAAKRKAAETTSIELGVAQEAQGGASARLRALRDQAGKSSGLGGQAASLENQRLQDIAAEITKIEGEQTNPGAIMRKVAGRAALGLLTGGLTSKDSFAAMQAAQDAQLKDL